MSSVCQQLLLSDDGVQLLPSVVQRVPGNNGASRTTSSTPAWSAVTAGNVIMLEFFCETNAAGPSTPAGYSVWSSGNLSNGGTITTTIFYKIAAGGETGVTVSHGNNNTSWVMREHVAPLGTVTFGTPVTGTSLTPDPPSVAFSSGNYVVIEGNSYPSGTMTFSAASSGYSSAQTTISGSNGVAGASAEKVVAGTSEDPGVQTFTGTASKFAAYTYAVG